MAAGGRFSISDVALRFVAAFALVVATWNPTGMSFGHWLIAMERADALGPVHAFSSRPRIGPNLSGNLPVLFA